MHRRRRRSPPRCRRDRGRPTVNDIDLSFSTAAIVVPVQYCFLSRRSKRRIVHGEALFE